MTGPRLHIVLRCDAGTHLGVGHVVRGLALADELLSRGAEVTVVGSVDGPGWVCDEIAARGLDLVPSPISADALAALVGRLGADAVVLDGYDIDARVGATLRGRGLVVLAVHDGPFGADQAADLYLDQNLAAAAPTGHQVPTGARALTGLSHALFRDRVLRYRAADEGDDADDGNTDGGDDLGDDRVDVATRAADAGAVPRVLTVFGGTDATGAAPVMVPLLLATGCPVHVVAVAATTQIARQINDVLPDALVDGQSVEVIAPTPELARLASECDAAVSASGTSLWELLCLGVPTALVAVVANQRVGHDAAGEHGVALALGEIEHLRDDPQARAAAVTTLGSLVTDPALRRRLARAGRGLIDGQGRVRVVDALFEAIARSPRHHRKAAP